MRTRDSLWGHFEGGSLGAYIILCICIIFLWIGPFWFKKNSCFRFQSFFPRCFEQISGQFIVFIQWEMRNIRWNFDRPNQTPHPWYLMTPILLLLSAAMIFEECCYIVTSFKRMDTKGFIYLAEIQPMIAAFFSKRAYVLINGAFLFSDEMVVA